MMPAGADERMERAVSLWRTSRAADGVRRGSLGRFIVAWVIIQAVVLFAFALGLSAHDGVLVTGRLTATVQEAQEGYVASSTSGSGLTRVNDSRSRWSLRRTSAQIPA